MTVERSSHAPEDDDARNRHPTSLWVADVIEMQARLRRRSPAVAAATVTLEAYQESDEPA